jgi:hypothetical protein
VVSFLQVFRRELCIYFPFPKDDIDGDDGDDDDDDDDDDDNSNASFLHLGYFPFLKSRIKLMTSPCRLCLCPCLKCQLLKQVTDLYEIWYARYAFGGHCNFVLLLFYTVSEITWRIHKHF